MPVKKDPSGRRSIELSVELPGTPEQVWQAVATGPGTSAWFVPTEIEEREGGAIAFHLGPGMTSTGRVTTWQPPHRFGYEESGWSGEAPPLATEITVEAQAGGTCTVRLVHSLFTERDDWDGELGSMERGWPPCFEVLRYYLTNFPGARCGGVQAIRHHPGELASGWRALRDALGLPASAAGQTVATAGDAPPLAGQVERMTDASDHCELTLRLAEPAPGLAALGGFVWGGRTHVSVRLYLYGDEAPAVAAAEEPRWQAWMAERFPTLDG